MADHKLAFSGIRNFLAGRMLGATRDQSLLEEVMKCLFAYKAMVRGGQPIPKDHLKRAAAYREALQGVHVPFAETDQLLLDPASIEYIHGHFCQLDLFNADRDPVGDLYETFVGSAIRGSEGQFFTPLNAVEWLTDAVGLRSGEAVIDPACGAGGFLIAAAKHGLGLDLFGIEKDSYLADLARARLQVLEYKHEIFCANSLSLKQNGKGSLRHLLGEFDVVLANPPFGKNIRSVDVTEQAEFSLGHRWKKARGNDLEQTPVLLPNVPPQVLFVERIMTLLRDGGRAGIVVPESLLCGKSYAPVVQYLQKNAAIRAVVGMPEALFKHSGKGGTHTKTCLLVFTKGKSSTRVYMAEAAWCGHDSRGRKIDRDDIPAIAAEYARFGRAGAEGLGLGYEVSPKELEGNILAPRYHEPTAQKVAGHLVETHELVTVGALLESGELEVSAGNEVGKLAYGGGSIPFVRTSDLSGWEIKADPKHLVSEDVYNRFKGTQDVRRRRCAHGSGRHLSDRHLCFRYQARRENRLSEPHPEVPLQAWLAGKPAPPSGPAFLRPGSAADPGQDVHAGHHQLSRQQGGRGDPPHPASRGGPPRDRAGGHEGDRRSNRSARAREGRPAKCRRSDLPQRISNSLSSKYLAISLTK